MSTAEMLPPIATLRARLAAAPPGAHAALVDDVLARAAAPAAHAVFTALLPDDARAAARAADARRARGQPALPLDGLPVTVKDLYDLAGRTTMAGSRVCADDPPAAADAPAVARLRGAGAALVGLTNMTEFAFSGVGLNPHHGTPRNPHDAAVHRIPGGSSSGAAVSVALGLAVAALGSDTGGSIRVPAALCGITGFKNTRARTPSAGAFPLSTTLDTVCAMARGVDDCLIVDGVLAGAPLTVVDRPLRGVRLRVPGTLVLDALAPVVADAFARALSTLSAAGARIDDAPLPELAEIADLNRPSGIAAVEGWAVHRARLDSADAQVNAARRSRLDPRVLARLRGGADVSAADYLDLLARRAAWIARMERLLVDVDAVVCPTVPITAPALDALIDDDAAFFRTNALLLRNTFVANFLDGCSWSLPCPADGPLPVGLMLTAPGGHDTALAAVARAVEAALAAAG